MNIRKYEVLNRIFELGVVGIIRTPDVTDGIASAEAISRGESMSLKSPPPSREPLTS